MKKNIVLIGMPGSGKTAIGRIIAQKLGRDFVDVDEFIKKQTGRDTADHLKELGDKGFLRFEAEIVKKIQGDNLVVASSGSVPLQKEGIDHLKDNSALIWMDIPIDIISKRVSSRSDGVSRIVGAETMTIEEIRELRLQKYQENHDFYFTIEKELPRENVAQKLLSLIQENEICGHKNRKRPGNGFF
ncbi:MAG: AAA family ATPase [Candidatus Gracilibacteria bacterium]|nr:AAA family ATPase [Candidatus Gracilibacteria bacterium]